MSNAITGAGRKLMHVAAPAGLAISQAVLVLMAVHIVADVGARYFLGRPLDGTTEIVSRYYMVALIFLPLAYVQATGRHVEASFFADALPDKAKAALGCLTSVLMLAFAVLLAWQAGIEAARSTAISEKLQTASYFLLTWPGRWIPVLGMALVALQSLVDLAAYSGALLGRRPLPGAEAAPPLEKMDQL